MPYGVIFLLQVWLGQTFGNLEWWRHAHHENIRVLGSGHYWVYTSHIRVTWSVVRGTRWVKGQRKRPIVRSDSHGDILLCTPVYIAKIDWARQQLIALTTQSSCDSRQLHLSLTAQAIDKREAHAAARRREIARWPWTHCRSHSIPANVLLNFC